MNRIKIHRFIITVLTIACIGLNIEGYMEEWEFWVGPVMVMGAVCLWVFHISQLLSQSSREAFYIGYGMFAAFFHGVHATSFFDVVTVVSLMLIVYSFLDRLYVLNMIMAEYVVIMLIQFILEVRFDNYVFDFLNVSRLILQVIVLIMIYVSCRMIVNGRLAHASALSGKNEDIISYDNDMEDFLSNISHELRTPVNVVSGMSMLMMKDNPDGRLLAISEAGIRLSKQIEDIKDYTEIKRDGLLLEEDNYMIISLINDVIMEFRNIIDEEGLELVVDLSPDVPAVMKGDVKKLGKVLRHLLDNSVKFTRHGGIYLKVYVIARKYGVNLCMEVTDTGIGMQRQDIAMAGMGLYQANKKRNRSTGGIGLGLPLAYGLVHKMGGFIKIESEQGTGTTVRVTVPQAVVNEEHCLYMENPAKGDIIFHVRSGKYKIPAIREFYGNMATNLAEGLGRRLYSAENAKEVEHLIEKYNIGYIFMGEEEYSETGRYFDNLSRRDIIVAVSAKKGFRPAKGSGVIVIPKPLYGLPVVKVLNGRRILADEEMSDKKELLKLEGIRALIVDDEPMNLIVAVGLMQQYKMSADTAESGMEAISKFESEDYDIVFMDHMMPEMDGVEAMKHIKKAAGRLGRNVIMIAFTANAVSGAKEMFLKEGFDGFIAKPIDVAEFERVMQQVLPQAVMNSHGGEPV